MRKLFLSLSFIIMTTCAINAQALEQGAEYISTVTSTEGKEYTFNISVQNDNVINVDDITSDDVDFKKTIWSGNSSSMTWINSGGNWEETQTFTFVKDPADGMIFMYWFRIVQNQDHIPWEVLAAGPVYKQ